jgi:hypothetical protein
MEDIKELSQQIYELSQTLENKQKMQLWEDVFALKLGACAVNFYFYQYVWQNEFAGDTVQNTDPLSKSIEAQLRFQLWRNKNIKDDVPILPYVKVPAKRPAIDPFTFNSGRQSVSLFGLETKITELETRSFVSEHPIKEYKDVKKIKLVEYQEETEVTNEILQRAQEMVGDNLEVLLKNDLMEWGPFEYAVQLRGMNNLLYDFYDAPDFVHELMERIVAGTIEFQKTRETAAKVDARLSLFGSSPFDHIPEQNIKKLSGMWAKCHAQSSGSLGPDMYAEFVHPYNSKLTELVGRVYYHGCEDLSEKCKIIKDLPNLHLFHISPWTSEEAVYEHMHECNVAFEIHSHPTGVLENYTKEEMKSILQKRHDVFKDKPHTLMLADIEVISGKLDRLKMWVDVAQEVANS